MGFRNVSLRTQVLLVLLVTAAVSCVAVAWAAERGADEALDTAITDGLTAARSRARRQVADYFKTARSETRLLGETPTVAEAAAAFAEAFEQAPPADEATADALRRYYAEQFIPSLARLPAEPDAAAPAAEDADPAAAPAAPAAQNPDADPADDAAAGDPLPENFLPTDPRGVRLQAAFFLNRDGAAEKEEEWDAPAAPAVPPEYAAAHERFHTYLASVKAELGLYDLFLAAPDGGRILYSVEKGVDFATSLSDGPYRGSNLAEVVRRAAASPKRGIVHFADFAPYGPSGADPAAFLATPVIDGPRVVGVLAVQLSVEKLDAAMTGGGTWEREGLGESGQVYLVGPDRLMRSNSRYFLEDDEGYLAMLKAAGRPAGEVDAVRRAGTTILRRTVDNPAVRAALRGETGAMTVTDFRGNATLTSFAPLDLPAVRYAVIAEKGEVEAFGPVRKLRKDLAVLTAGVVCGVTLLSVLAAAWLTRPIRKLTTAAARVGTGASDVRVRVRGRDEFARLGTAFNEMVDRIAEGRDALAAQAAENERLLCAILPEPVALRMKAGERRIADSFADVTVLFAELVGFGRLTERADCRESVGVLNELVSAFDEAAEAAGVEKVKTIGESYMAVCGLSVPRLDHTRRTVEFALELGRVVDRFNAARDLDSRDRLGVRVGINAGPVTAGVVGTRKFLYDLWGDTVTIAADLQEAAPPGTVRVTAAVYETVRDQFSLVPDEPVAVPGKGEVPTYRVLDEDAEETQGAAAGTRVAAGAGR